MPIAFDLSEWLQPQLHVRGTAAIPLNRHLHDLLLQAMRAGLLPAGTRLPSTRTLSGQLGLARNTVIDAYANLAAQGCLLTRAGSGTVVADGLADEFRPSRKPSSGSQPAAQLSCRGAQLLQGAGVAPQQWGAFMPGVPDVTEFPARTWLRLYNRQWRQQGPERLSYAPPGGWPALRQALAEHLALTRAVRCSPEQIIITSGSHQALDLVARLLCDAGDTVWLEDPCYWGLRSTLSSLGLQLRGLPVDEEGFCWPDDEGHTPPRLLVLTPSHQYPLGMVMGLARRKALLARCRAAGTWIVEDDYDSEFRYDTRPVASLQGLDGGERVLYVGSFSKTLFPGLRIGYLVVPKPLAASFAKASAELYREGQLMQQATLADFIAEGHLASQVRRMRALYSARRQALLAAVRREFGSRLPIHGDNAGLHLVLGLPPNCDDLAVEKAAASAGVAVRALSRYYAAAHRREKGLLLGYACVPDDQVQAAFASLAVLIRRALVD